MHVTASGMQTYFTLDKVQSMLINGGGGFLYTRAIKNKQSSETGRTQDTEQGQSRINNPARQAGHKTQNKDKQN
jgi:hypothetical protein